VEVVEVELARVMGRVKVSKGLEMVWKIQSLKNEQSISLA
jgi:hypothetical protein